MDATDEAAIAALIPLPIAHAVLPAYVDRLAWHLFLADVDVTDPPTVTGAYRTWNCPRSGAGRREAFRRRAVELLEAALLPDASQFPVPVTDGSEVGQDDNGVVIYAG